LLHGNIPHVLPEVTELVQVFNQHHYWTRYPLGNLRAAFIARRKPQNTSFGVRIVESSQLIWRQTPAPLIPSQRQLALDLPRQNAPWELALPRDAQCLLRHTSDCY
jgi:hypothetical protein